MQFRKCSIGGKSFGKGYTEISLSKAKLNNQKIEENMLVDEELLKDKFVNYVDPEKEMETVLKSENKKERERAHMFWKGFFFFLNSNFFKFKNQKIAIALCNNVIADEVEEQNSFDRSYQSSSPDEASLVRAARSFGFEVRKTNVEEIVVKINNEEKNFKILAILEFQSERKRMSVIVEDEDGIPTIFCKGADEVLFSLLAECKENDEELIKKTKENLDDFSNDGLRTLVVAYKKMEKEFFLEWHKRWINTENEMVLSVQQELRRNLSLEIEKDLILLGGTALEDKLQDGLSETISLIGRMGIKLWVLTGKHQKKKKKKRVV